MLTLEQRVRSHPEVVDTTLGEGEVVLLHLESKIYYSLNLTGQRIWQGLKEGLTLKEISRRLQEEFEVDADRADRSVLDLVNELCAKKLAQPEAGSSQLDLPPELRLLLACVKSESDGRRPPAMHSSGYFSESPFFPCAPLELKEFNLDYRGSLTLCCHLSGYAGTNSDTDLMGNLHEVSLADACDRFRQRVTIYLADKRERVSRGEFGNLDHFPCWYCVKYLGKVPGLRNVPQYSWALA